MTWESTGTTYRTYLPPSGIRYHRGGSSTSPPPPPAAAASASVSASASRYLSTCVNGSRYGPGTAAPRSHLLYLLALPGQLRINQSARSHSCATRIINPSSLADLISADPLNTSGQVGCHSHPDTHAGPGTGPGVEMLHFRGVYSNSVLGFDFSTGFVVWVGR